MNKNIEVIQGNPTEEELVALSIAIQKYFAQKKSVKSSKPKAHWQLTNRLNRQRPSWMVSEATLWSYAERMSELWLD